ncbi:MAG: hypothetical protein IPJ18_13790 [Betaproteobacteria bacterium]|nr:hypothetical protein [Betaproteobacteria bacterium]
MNKSYRSIYNEATGAWVAVSETTSARGKKSSGKKAAVAAVIALHLAVSGSAYAANAGLAGGTNVGTTGTGMGTTNANHQAVTLSGDDDYCGSMNIAGRTNVAGGHHDCGHYPFCSLQRHHQQLNWLCMARRNHLQHLYVPVA